MKIGSYILTTKQEIRHDINSITMHYDVIVSFLPDFESFGSQSQEKSDAQH